MILRGDLRFLRDEDAREYFTGVNFVDREGASTPQRIDPMLNILVRTYCWLHFKETGSHAVVTHVFRNWAKQDEIYGQDKKYQESPFPSVHFYGRGVDMRVAPQEPIRNRVRDVLNSIFIYDPTRPEKKCCLIHEVTGGGKSQGLHAHLQVHPNTTLVNYAS